jgi:hypothetical protein
MWAAQLWPCTLPNAAGQHEALTPTTTIALTNPSIVAQLQRYCKSPLYTHTGRALGCGVDACSAAVRTGHAQHHPAPANRPSPPSCALASCSIRKCRQRCWQVCYASKLPSLCCSRRWGPLEVMPLKQGHYVNRPSPPPQMRRLQQALKPLKL